MAEEEGRGGIAVPDDEGENTKSSWPELVGLPVEEAERKIKAETAAGTRIFVIPHDSFVTMDFRTDRVRIFVNHDGKVHNKPCIG